MTIDIEHFEEKLLAEKELLEKELEQVARRNPDNPTEWEPLPANDRDISKADDNTVADAIEGYEDNAAIMSTLEERYENILKSLKRIEEGKYGLCEVCGQEIELDRLEANPSAQTCKAHL